MRLISKTAKYGTVIRYFLIATVCMLLIPLYSYGDTKNGEQSDVSNIPVHKRQLKTIIVDNYYPYTFVNENGDPDGFSVDLIRAVAHEMGLELKIHVDTWDLARNALKDGDIDVLPMMAYSKERDRQFDFSVPHTIAYDAFFSRKDASKIQSLNDLRGKKIIVMKGDQAHDYLLSIGLTGPEQLILIDSLPDALTLLSSGKGDAALMPKLVGLIVAKNLKLSNLELSPIVIEAYKRPFSFAVAEGNLPLLERLSQGLSIVKTSDQYSNIYKKWFGALEPPGFSLKTVLKYIGGTILAFILIGSVLLLWSFSLKRQVILRTKSLGEEISERKQTEEALRESETKYRILFEQMTQGAFRQRADGRLIDVNPAALKMFGLTRDEFLGRTSETPVWDVVHEDGSPFSGPEHPSMVALRTGKPISGVILGVLNEKAHERIWVEINAIPEFRPGENKPYQVMVAMHDLTDYKQAQVELKESEDKFRSFAEQSLVGIYLISDSVFKYVNPKFAEIFGYSVNECLDNMYFRKLVHPEDLATVQKQVGRRVSGETKAVRYSFRGIKKSGETIHVEIFGSSMLLKGKSVATGTMLDITESKRAEASLQREKENLSTTLDNNPHGIVLIDNNGKWIYHNPMFTEITGYTAEDIQKGQQWFQKAYPDADYRKKVIDAWKENSKQEGKGDNYEFNVTCKDGQVKQIEFSTAHLSDRSVSVLTDVTQRKKIEKSLYEAKLFLDNISDLAYMADSEGNIIYANPAAEKITGLALNEIIDRPLLPLIVEKDHNFLTEVYNRTLAGESLENIVTFNSGITCHFTSLPFKDNHGNIIGTFGIARDISDRLDAEEALKESEGRLKKAQSVAKLGNWEYDISTRKIWGSEQAFRIYGIERTSPYLPLDRIEACIP